MDPVTQGILGAIAPQALTKTKNLGRAGFIGAVAGMSPDLDILIRSSTDPLLFLEYHRQFTHSIIFIPFGALLCALLIQALLGKRWQLSFAQSYLYCFLGYATHALLDANTTYGTMLFWPFSDMRIAWNTIAVIDPLYTIPLLLAVLLSIWKQKVWLVRLSLIWVFLYPVMGMMQRDKAEQIARQFVKVSSDEIISLSAKPSMANITLWKIIYETKTHFYVDAIRIGIFQNADKAKYFEGDSVKKLDLNKDFIWLDKTTQQAKDIQRFSHFSNNFLAIDPNNKNRIVDIRYSILPNEIKSLWGIELNPQATADDYVKYVVDRDVSSEKRKMFMNMLFE